MRESHAIIRNEKSQRILSECTLNMNKTDLIHLYYKILLYLIHLIHNNFFNNVTSRLSRAGLRGGKARR